jgi:hypothetical protein
MAQANVSRAGPKPNLFGNYRAVYPNSGKVNTYKKCRPSNNNLISSAKQNFKRFGRN